MKHLFMSLAGLLLGLAATLSGRTDTILGRAEYRNNVLTNVTSGQAGAGADLASATLADGANGRTNIDLRPLTLAAGTYDVTEFAFTAINTTGTVRPFLTERITTNGQHRVLWLGSAGTPTLGINRVVPAQGTASRFTLATPLTVYAGFVMTQTAVGFALPGTPYMTDHQGTPLSLSTNQTFTVNAPNLARSYAFALQVQSTTPGRVQPASIGFTAGGSAGPATVGSRPNNGTHYFSRIQIDASVAGDIPTDPATTFAFGSPIVPLPALGADLTKRPHNISTNTAGRAFYSAAHDKVYGTNPGFVTITWSNLTAGVTAPVRYLVTSTPAAPVHKRIYHTHSAELNLALATPNQNSPAVSVAAVNQTVFHWNTSIPDNPSSPYLRRHTDNLLRAKDKQGLIVIEHRDSGGNTVANGVQIVEVLPPLPDPGVQTVAMGAILTPNFTNTVDGAAFVASGQLYVHNKVGDPFRHKMVVTQSRTDNTPIDVYWRQTDGLGIHWPFEFRRYAVSGLDPTATQVAIYHTEATLAPTVALPTAGVFMNIYTNTLIRTNDLFKSVGNVVRAANRTGEAVALYFNGSDATGTYLNREIIQLRVYAPDVAAGVVNLGDELAPFLKHGNHATNQTFVARGLQSSKTDAAGFIYQHSTTDSGPHAGRIFAVKPTTTGPETEVFWRRQGTYSVWPYEMRRFTQSWPGSGQRFVRRAAGEILPKVAIPTALGAALWPSQTVPAGVLAGGTEFHTTGAGWSLLGFESGPAGNRNYVGFKPILSTLRTDAVYTSVATTNWVIGVEITDPAHQGPRSGITYEPTGDEYEPAIYTPKDTQGWTTGQVFAVNTGTIEMFWSNLMQPNPADAVNRIQWPSMVRKYNNQWPVAPPKAVIASTLGTGAITNTAWYAYIQNNPALPGYNPNDEHVVRKPANGGSGEALFPLRNDLGSAGTSLPYLVVPYRVSASPTAKFGVKIWRVLAEDTGITFTYSGITAGTLIQPPYPLSGNAVPTPAGTSGISGPYFMDRKGAFWAKAAGDNGGATNVVMRFFYTTDTSFAFPGAQNTWPSVGSSIAWLDSYAQTSGQGTGANVPKNVTYTIQWPTTFATLRMGETLSKAKFGLPDVLTESSVQILYQQATAQNPAKSSVKLIDPLQTRELAMALPPTDLEKDLGSGGRFYFPAFPPHLRNRLFYDPSDLKIKLIGQFVPTLTGLQEQQGYLLLNTLSARDAATLKALSADPIFDARIDSFAALPLIEFTQTPPAGAYGHAITAGFATAPGFVTIATGNQSPPSGSGSAVALKVFKVDCPPYIGDLNTVESDNPFDEQLTLRHTGDFAGAAQNYEFEWRTRPPDGNGLPPSGPYTAWDFFKLEDGALDITISGPGLFTLTDNFFVCRYRPKTFAPLCVSGGNPQGWSDWTAPGFSPGWIKRVLAGINPFEQRVTNTAVNTIVSMLSQAGKRYIGDAPLNAAAANSFGLIEIYETVLKRGIALSIEGAPPVNNAGANDALLLAAGRLADFYMLLGNEAYADASDPTIALSGQTSIHAFMNQTANLLEEELNLLRGRDDALLPNIRTHPTYNRMIWNFTTGDGEVAYAGNYNTTSEVDAATKYPQGHGDAWGHYLTAIKNYYRLLRNPNYTHVPRIETVLVGGAPVSVDFLDERKFARAAAARARTGAEVASLTYRQRYTEDPAGQWQGYEDSDTARAWGMSEWSRRAGQGAFLDWVVGNALLPEKDSNPAHTGIQVIDRKTVLELREIAGSYQDIQRQMDQADTGLNPLGLAKNVVPFDISPSGIDQGKTHFEQIYERAATALNNAISVFNYANGSSVALRAQSDQVLDFQRMANEREIDFRNRLIEIFGSPYLEDIGPGKTWPVGYTGPDLVNFGYVDSESLTGIREPNATTLSVTFTNQVATAGGGVVSTPQTVNFNLAESRFHLVKPASFSTRQSPGEIQRSLSDLIQARLNFQRALNDYNAQLERIQAKADLIALQHNVNATEIRLLNGKNSRITDLNAEIRYQRELQVGLNRAGAAAAAIADGIAEALPRAVGLANDVTSVARGAIKVAGAAANLAMGIAADVSSIKELDFQQQKDLTLFGSTVETTQNQQAVGVANDLEALRDLLRTQNNRILELYSMNEAMQQAGAAYQTALARGVRILEDRDRFRKDTGTDVRAFRYKDMAFRIFRNDALQKYRAQFDLASRYVYLAAKAYDFETNLQSTQNRAGESFLTDIVRARSLGLITGGIPQTGGTGDPGLADPMARMSANFAVLNGQLGFNNPTADLLRFSLRKEHFRISAASDGAPVWKQALRRHVVPNLLAVPEFKRFCIPFNNPLATEPALVIPFTSVILTGQNFFGNALAGGDNAFNSTYNSIKLREVGVNFISYNNTVLSPTPTAYLVPAGADILRSPNLARDTREWKILDQTMPVPFPGLTGGTISGPNFNPSYDSLTGNFVDIRRFPSLAVGTSTGAVLTNNSQLIGRSVWNTRWVLIIPAATILNDRTRALNVFIDGEGTTTPVTDIQINFKTYSYSGILN